jgi:hypothetical protein
MHKTPSKSVRLPVEDGAELMEFYRAYWRPAGYRSLTEALVDAWRQHAKMHGWTPPGERAEVDAAMASTRPQSQLLEDRPVAGDGPTQIMERPERSASRGGPR